MPVEVQLPKLGLTMQEGTIARWLVPDGATVAAGAPVLLMETDKVEAEVEAPAAGTLRHGAPEGSTFAPGTCVGWVLADGEVVPAPASPVAPAPQPGGGRRFVSPNARRVAAVLGVDLAEVAGSGPGGRVVSEDVEELAARRPAATAVPATAVPVAARPTPAARAGTEPLATTAAVMLARRLGIDLGDVVPGRAGEPITRADVEGTARATKRVPAPSAPSAVGPSAPARRPGDRIPIKGMRRTIAQRMHASLQGAAQLTLTMDAPMARVVDLRAQLEGAGLDAVPSYTDFVIAAVARALGAHPLLNSTVEGDDIVLLADVHVGMAVALDEGLIVPVVHHTDRLPLVDLAVETSRLAAAARDGNLTVDEVNGSTFTVTALGMFGVDAFTPIINAPNTAILGVGRVRDVTTWEGDRPVRDRALTLSLTWDHRLVDGAPAARFTRAVCDLLAHPARLLV